MSNQAWRFAPVERIRSRASLPVIWVPRESGHEGCTQIQNTRRFGTPPVLEINPNCEVYYPPTDPGTADICLAHDPAGHEGLTRQLVAAALARHAHTPRHSLAPCATLPPERP